ncbi:MAG TPA: carbon-nitrogen hydrolase family protein, partial [Gemmatimonadaceae bacterium]
HHVATILGMEWIDGAGPMIAAVVIDAAGDVRGIQTKVQLDPTEESLYVPGRGRQLFEIDGLRFGIAICHEGFRYPETVRWAARRGAQVVFHPHCTGSDRSGVRPTAWGAPDGAYYEKAVMCRALENSIYVASVNYAFRYQESATSIISPTGECVAHLPYGEEGVLVHDLALDAATGLLARRYAPERYEDAPAG